MKACKFYSEKYKNYENNDLGENYKICLVGRQDPAAGSSTKRTIWTKMTEMVDSNDMKNESERARSTWKQ